LRPLTPQVDTATGDVEYLHGDLVGSVRLLTDAAGDDVGAADFDPYGRVGSRTGVTSAFGYSGNWTDPDMGFVYLRARDYDPLTGQFVQVDPAVDETRQPYAYAGNNPLQFTDPTGLFLIPPASGALALLTWFTHPLASVPGWLFGYSNNDKTFSQSDVLGQQLLLAPETEAARDLIRQDLRDGLQNITRSATYSAGSDMLGNLLRDMATYLHPSGHSTDDRLKAALGSYILNGNVVSMDEHCRIAVIEWSGFNQVSLGSALGFKIPVVEFTLDMLPFILPGPQTDAVNQTFALREEIRF
jgi:RHS repeat-associated protein